MAPQTPMRPLTWNDIPGHGSSRRFAILDRVAVATGNGSREEWSPGVITGVTYGRAPLYDVVLARSGEILHHVTTDQLAPLSPSAPIEP